MKKEVHVTSAHEHMKIADDYDKKMEKEKDPLKKIGLRTVASQNYFYAGINAIESMLAAKDIHSFNHENRNRHMIENPDLFDDGFFRLYNEIDRDLRNKVAYRGVNGSKYKQIKDFAKKAVDMI